MKNVTQRESKRFKRFLGIISVFTLVFGLGIPLMAGATVSWQGTGSGQAIEDVIGESLSGGLYSFGWSIDTDGNMAVVGNPAYDSETGEVFILQYNSVNNSWTRLARLSSPTPTAGERFGWSVAISGNTVVVGDLGETLDVPPFPLKRGATYVYTKPAGGWSDNVEPIQLAGPNVDINDSAFGHSVDISDDGQTILVGSPNVTGGYGAGFVYKKPAGGWESTSSTNAILPGVISDGWAGYSSAISANGEVVVLGGANNIPNEALVFTDLSGDWSTFNGPIVLNPGTIRDGSVFGMSVAVSANGDTVVVGARHDDTDPQVCSGSNGTGAAYVFYSPGASWSNSDANTVARLSAFEPQCGSVFGESVAIKDDVILVGSPWFAKNNMEVGAVYVYAKPTGGWSSATENVQLFDSPHSSYFQYYGQDTVFLGDKVFSISVMSTDGSKGFSTIPVTETRVNFLTTPVLVSADSGLVSSTISVLDIRNNTVNLVVEYSTDGNSWQPATLTTAGDSNGALTVSDNNVNGINNNAYGHEINFTWDSVADGIGQSGTVYLRVTPDNGQSVTSESFALDNPFALFAPTGLIARDVTTSSLELFWNPVVNVVSYSVSSTATSESIITTNTSTIISGLIANTAYDFKVLAINGSGENTNYSTLYSVYTLANTPSNLSATVDGKTQITLNWSGNASEYYADNGISNSGWISVNTYTFANLTCATDYNFSVKGRNGNMVETDNVTTAARTADCGNQQNDNGNIDNPPANNPPNTNNGNDNNSDNGNNSDDSSVGGGETDEDNNSSDQGVSDRDQNNNGQNSASTGSSANGRGNSASTVSGNSNSAKPANEVSSGSLEIPIATATAAGLIPSAQAGENVPGLNSNRRGFFDQLIAPEHRLVTILALAVALIVIIGGGIWFYLAKKHHSKETENASKVNQTTEDKK